MTQSIENEADLPPPPPIVRPATVDDIVGALEAGFRDLRRAPLYGLFFGAFYAIGGMVIVYATAVWHLSWIAFPVTAGFALIGPFVAVGLYEVSRRIETGQPLSWSAIFGCILSQGGREMGWMALITVFTFVIWMYQVRMLFALFFGISAMPMEEFWQNLFLTQTGLTFLIIGTLWGAVLATVVFALTVVSFPLLLDRDRDFITAMITSVKAVIASPKVMVAWGLITAALLMLAAMPFFLGLILVLPVLGHTTWHLYRRIVLPA